MSFALGITPASESLFAFTIIMKRIVVSLAPRKGRSTLRRSGRCHFDRPPLICLISDSYLDSAIHSFSSIEGRRTLIANGEDLRHPRKRHLGRAPAGGIRGARPSLRGVVHPRRAGRLHESAAAG